MKPAERALLYIRRRKATSILMVALLAVLFLTSILGFGLIRSLNYAQTELRKTYAGAFTVSPSSAAVQSNQEARTVSSGETKMIYSGPELNDDMVEKIADFDGIKAYTGERSMWFVSDDITLIPGFLYYWANNSENDQMREDMGEEEVAEWMAEMNQTLYTSCLYSELSETFRKEQFSLIEGRHITPKDTHCILISDELAEKNGLSVGDTVQASNLHLDGFEEYDGFEVSLTIIGIFHMNASQIVTEDTNESYIAANHIYVDAQTSQDQEMYAGWYFSYEQATFFVDDPEKIDDIISGEKARDDIPWEYFEINVDESEYQTAAASIRTLQTAIWVILVILIVVLLAVLFLILRMSLNHRKQEVKIYRSLGFSKRNILNQLLIEGLLISLFAFIPMAIVSSASASVVTAVAQSFLLVEDEVPQAYTNEDVRTASQDGTLQQLLEESARLYYDEPVSSVTLEVENSMGLTLTVLGIGLITVLGFTAWQSRALFRIPLR